MKRSFFIFLTLFLFIQPVASQIVDSFDTRDRRDTFGKSYFNARTQSPNNARLSAGMGNLITWGYDDCSRLVLWSTAEYSQSFGQNQIGTYLFFNGTDTMRTGTANGPGIDIFAQNFLLNDNFNSAITAHPRVKNGLIDINFYGALDFCCQGLYILATIPFVHTQWNVDLKESFSFTGTGIAANSLGNPVTTAAPFNSMIEAWNGQATFADVTQPLRFARIDGSQSKSRLSDIEIILGYTFLNNECNYFSVNLCGIIPTGNKPTGEFFFEPVVGNGHHGAFGAGILGNFLICESCDEFLTIFLNASAYTLFNSRQQRTFDLINNGVGSRYLLFKRFQDGLYAGEIVRGPNILTLPINTKNNIIGDAVVMLEYVRGQLIIDGGYNLWGRSRDHITLKGTIPENTFGVAGLSGTAGVNRNLTANATQINGINATIIDAAPVFISNANLDIESAAHPGTFSHSFFTHLGYIFDSNYLQPFIGIGTQVEFSGTNKSFKMWHLWGKVGFTF